MSELNLKNKGKSKTKRGKKIMKILGSIAAFIAFFLVIGSVLQATYFRGKLEKVKPYGQVVDVKDGQMHIYSMGDGEKTIVLLPGMGVGLPSADFSPLMRKLSEKHTVVAVEYFGVGFSSKTERERSTENYVEEIREGLKEAGFKPPYILMPHSISSVYSEYYASKYKEEVEGIVSLDGTSTDFHEEMPSIVKYVLPIAKFQQGAGIVSIAGNLIIKKDELLSYGYTEKEIRDMITFAGFSINDNLLEQMMSTPNQIRDTKALEFPSSVPYFKVISKTTYETPNKQLKMTPQEYQHQHLERIGNHAQYEILEGTHFIYFNNAARISEIVEELLK